MSRAAPLLAAVAAAIGVAGATALWAGMRQADAPTAADIGFCQDMAAHHDQAVLMATLALDRGGPTVKALAASILASQSQETGMMRGWLQLWGQPPMAALLPAGGGGSGAYCLVPRRGPMPGMASAQELNQLWRGNGGAFDVLFLQLMIRHHEGGLLMSREARLRAGLEVVRNTAQAMLVEQGEELAQMRRLLQADGAQPLR